MDDGDRVRSSLNGSWKLDKTRGRPSMRGYLETMGVNELAIEAHEKADAETDTVHVVELTDATYEVKKSSRVNDLTIRLVLNEVERKPLSDDRVKTTIATSDGPGHVKVVSSMPTINGNASVTDVKTLVQDVDGEGNKLTLLRQELTVVNELSGKTHTTVRFFVPQGTGEESASSSDSQRKKDAMDEG